MGLIKAAKIEKKYLEKIADKFGWGYSFLGNCKIWPGENSFFHAEMTNGIFDIDGWAYFKKNSDWVHYAISIGYYADRSFVWTKDFTAEEFGRILKEYRHI